jgi:hypothetical protein
MSFLARLFGKKPQPKVIERKATPAPVAAPVVKAKVLDLPSIDSINDENELAKLALDGAITKLRQEAAEKITDKQILQQLLKDTKTKDKTVFKIIKEKCDAFKEEDKRAAEILAGVAAAVQSLEQQSNRPFDGQFTAKLSYLVQQWEAKKADATSELIARADQAIQKAQHVKQKKIRRKSAKLIFNSCKHFWRLSLAAM